MTEIIFSRAATTPEREAINLFLTRHNQRGMGSAIGYVAYYAAAYPPDGRPLVERIVAAAKIHHPDYGGSAEDFQRLRAAYEQALKAQE